MKKIIATVLAMVMALALCTTAFAATTSETVVNGTTTTLSVNDDYDLRELSSNENATEVKGSIAYTDLSTKTVVTDGKETKTYKAAYYSIKTAADSGDVVVYYVCDAKFDGAKRLFKDGAFVAYVAQSSLASDWLKGGTLVAKGSNCGDASADGVTIGSDTYPTTDATATTPVTPTAAAIVDGKLVGYTTANKVEAVKHDFSDGATETYKANSTTPVSVVCKTCKKAFDVVKANELGSYAGTYVATGSAANKTDAIADTSYVIKLAASSTSTGTTTGSTSPKTFDAGIAMYVGMALTSVAGSAVVIGKKKEF